MRLLTARAVTGVVLSGLVGCGGADRAANCPELADDVIMTVQELVEQVSTTEPDVDFEGLEGKMSEFETQADELGCTDEEMERLVTERIDDIEIEGPLAPVLPDLLRDVIDGATG